VSLEHAIEGTTERATGESSPHTTVLLEEAVDALAIKPDGVYVDATFGRGGHSRLILERLVGGRLIALDRDLEAIAAGKKITDPRLTLIHAPFSELGNALREIGFDRVEQKDGQVGQVDGVLMDLGVSSPQLDDAERGFSFRADAPLDMRMDTSRGFTAAEWLAKASQQQIAEVIKNYGEERFANAVAAAIVAARAGGVITTTRQLAEIVAQAVRTREKGLHPATRSFQAIRIHVNQELEELSLVLPQCLDALKPGGRLVAISFHSLEDRIVKRFMRDESRPPQLDPRLPIRAADLPKPRMSLVGKAVSASEVEIEKNPRARSAVMRVAELNE